MMVQFLLISREINSTEGFDVASMGKRPKDKAIQLDVYYGKNRNVAGILHKTSPLPASTDKGDHSLAICFRNPRFRTCRSVLQDTRMQLRCIES